MKTKEPQVTEYTDELNDEFSTAQIKTKEIYGGYKYDGNRFLRLISHFFWYRIIAYPIATIWIKLKYHHKSVNKEVVKQCKDKAFFMFANHTNPIADAVIPSLVAIPKDTYLIVHPNNVSIPVVGKVTPALGAIPLPANLAATKHFVACIQDKIDRKKAIMIYPEAHIWPFYTKIRPFKDVSFRYPVQFNAPCFCFTNTYQKRRFSKTPQIVTYIDGPFYPNPELSPKEQRTELRDKMYAVMCERAKNNNIEVIKYVKKGEGSSTDNQEKNQNQTEETAALDVKGDNTND